MGREDVSAVLEGRRIDFGDQTVADRVAEWAGKTPDATAVEAGPRSLSYREVNARADQLARWLRGEGIGESSVVGLELPRSADLIVAMLGVWRAGAAYLPLEPEWPAGRRAALLADAGAHLLLVAAGRERTLTVEWREAALADIDLDGGSEHDADGVSPGLDDLAYVLYTSGSTGAPKGVAVEHGQLLNYVAAATEAMHLDRCRRWALTSSVVADLGNTALFGALFNGATLVIAGEDDATIPSAFGRFIAERRIDAIKIAPSHLDALLDLDLPRLPGTVVLGGEPASRSLVDRIRRLAPDGVIYNHYGPTETTVGVMVHRVAAGSSAVDLQPLTQVLANSRVYVLDDERQIVTAGGVGEIHVGGAQVCRGYLNRQVDDAFVPDPFRPGERLYRTGDLGCVLAEGGIRWVGRVDHQVKIRGFRVDPAEVEAALLMQPDVQQAVVLAVRRDAESAELVACVVAESNAVADTVMRHVRERLKTGLPGHMVPSRWVAVGQFPRLPNGKIDRVALADRALERTDVAHVATPDSALETLLAQGIGTLLGRSAVGVDENIFDLGLHSLMVIKLAARIRKVLGVEIPPGVVFDHPTVGELAAALRARAHDASALEELAKAALPSTAPPQASIAAASVA